MDFVRTAADFVLQLSYDFASLTSAHEGPVDSLAFDSNHSRIASTGQGTLRVWDFDKIGKFLSRR